MGRQRFEALDGMRGVAALAVLLLHCTFVTHVLIVPGAFLSVDLFFVLSGFVISHAYEQRLRGGLALSEFLRARGKRLLPVHFWALGIVLLAMVVAFAGGAGRAGVTLPAILLAAAMNAFFIPDHLANDMLQTGLRGPAFGINSALWSLWDEWILNIVYALAIFAMRTRAIASLGAVSIAFAIWFALRFSGWAFGGDQLTLAPGIFRALAGFTSGVLIYRAQMLGWIQMLPSVPPWCVYASWLAICAAPQSESQIAVECIVAIVLAPLAVALLVRAERPVGPIFRWLGAVSYPLYVSHLAALTFVELAVRHFGLSFGAFYTIPLTGLALALAQLVKILSELRFPAAIRRAALTGQGNN